MKPRDHNTTPQTPTLPTVPTEDRSDVPASVGAGPAATARRRYARPFSLMEIVAASFLLALVLLPVVAMMLQCMRIVHESAVQRAALGLADLVLAEAVAGDPATTPLTGTTEAAKYFQVDVETTPCPQEPRLELVTVTVSWSPEQGRTREVVLKALRLRAPGRPPGGPLPPIPAKAGKRRG